MDAHEWQLEADSAHDAHGCRSEFISHLRTWSAPESDFAAAEVIYGELVGNVIRHANGRIRIHLEWTESQPSLRVRDFGRGFYHDFRLPEIMSESGRGLFIVGTLGERLDIECVPEGCEVRVVLPVWRQERPA